MIVLFFRRAGGLFLMGCIMLFILSAAGCGEAKGDLSGKVSYQGKLLAVGSVLLVGADVKPRTAWIEADGSYHFTDVPVGEAKLAVYSPDPAKQAKQAERIAKQAKLKKSRAEDEPVAQEIPVGDRTKWFAIPADCSDVDRSGLRVTIQRGSNTFAIEMK